MEGYLDFRKLMENIIKTKLRLNHGFHYYYYYVYDRDSYGQVDSVRQN